METHVRLSDTDNPDPLQRWFTDHLAQIEEAIGQFYRTYWPCDLQKPAELELSVTFMTPEEIAVLNKEYRDEDRSTDVLSFPLWEEAGAVVLPPDLGELLPLGDLFFCSEQCERNAKEHNVSVESELLLLLFHGCLHLLAWDHSTEEEEKRMWQAQEAARDELLAQLNEVSR